MFEKLTIHGHPVLAFIQTEVQSTGPCGIVLVHVVHKSEYVTAWYRCGDEEWSTGYWRTDLQEAYRDLLERSRILAVK